MAGALSDILVRAAFAPLFDDYQLFEDVCESEPVEGPRERRAQAPRWRVFGRQRDLQGAALIDGHMPFWTDIDWFPFARVTGYFKAPSARTHQLPALSVAIVEYRPPEAYLVGATRSNPGFAPSSPRAPGGSSGPRRIAQTTAPGRRGRHAASARRVLSRLAKAAPLLSMRHPLCGRRRLLQLGPHDG
jgi:hypothetical protein